MDDAEVWARLSRVLAGCERDAEALDGCEMTGSTRSSKAMNTLRAELVAAIAALGPES